MISVPVQLQPLQRTEDRVRPSPLSSPSRIARRALALVAVAVLSWASVVDNPAVCPDDVGEQGDASHGHGTPPCSHCCVTAPCHTPTTVRAAALPAALAASVVAMMPVAHRVLTSIDSPAPPTPPPTSLD